MVTALIVDDEILAAQRLEKLLTETGSIEVVGIFTNSIDVLNNFEALHPQVVFLDIEMPEMNGLVLAEKIMEIRENIQVVFVTAYNEYAVKAFELSAIDYLLKPVSKERLRKTVSRLSGNASDTQKNVQAFIKCFGGFEVHYNNCEKAIKFRTSKAEELLALLVLYKGKAISSDFIIETLWSEFEADKAMVNLHTSIYYLRKALKASGIADFIKTSRGHYFIDAKKIICDIYDFQEIVENIEDKQDDIETLQNTRKLYTGAFLEGKDYIWAEEKRSFFEQKYTEILIKLSDYYLKCRKYNNCIEILNIAIEINPFSDIVSQRLMNIFFIMNDKFNAVKYYNRYKKILNNELGIGPDENLKRIYENIINE